MRKSFICDSLEKETEDAYETRENIFTDLDGTLLNSRKQVSPEDKAAVLEALEQGCRIAVNTGRPLPAVLPLLERTGLNRQGCFAVTYNGG